MSVYNDKPSRFFTPLPATEVSNPIAGIYCAGFELKKWRCNQLSGHLVEWLPDYALIEEELNVTHANAFIKLQQAAVRVYTSPKYKRRGEAGEIALHAICRDFFDTVPISPRVFYKSASNDPVKSFDLVHARFPTTGSFELWLGESKLFTNRSQGVTEAIKSIKSHIEHGFLTNEKILLGPQISKATPHYDQIMEVFKAQTSIDKLLQAAVFVVGIAADSDATKAAIDITGEYVAAALAELQVCLQSLTTAEFGQPLRIALVYVPLASKKDLATAFDKRLKGLQ
jgi:hypothetical protein